MHSIQEETFLLIFNKGKQYSIKLTTPHVHNAGMDALIGYQVIEFVYLEQIIHKILLHTT